MNAFLVSLATVAVAEMGDRTQLLSLVLAARYRKPWSILAGILLASLANHAAAAAVGASVGRFLTPRLLDAAVGASLFGMALWALRPDHCEPGTASPRRSAFVATLVAFFLAEIGDKTQIATVALAAGFASLPAVILGTTSGMLIANLPAVLLGHAFSRRLPLKAIHYGAAVLFILLGLYFLGRAAM